MTNERFYIQLGPFGLKELSDVSGAIHGVVSSERVSIDTADTPPNHRGTRRSKRNGDKPKRTRIKAEDVREIKRLLALGRSTKQICAATQRGDSTVDRVKAGQYDFLLCGARRSTVENDADL